MRVFAALMLCQLSLFSALVPAADKATVYPYQFDESIAAKGQIRRVMLATTPLGKPPRLYLQGHEAAVRKQLVKYLRKGELEVLDSASYARALATARNSHGDAYDPSTGNLDLATHQRVLSEVFTSLKQDQPAPDAIIFADLLDRQVYFSGSMKRFARWDGVSRAPLMQGPGQGVPADFNWFQPVDAVSLGITVFTIDGGRLLVSVGGMSLTEAIDTRGTRPRFRRADRILTSAAQIKEGVALALHPLIPMKRYPASR